ncbi:hypothetical protein HDU98_007215 [Podochytrium sp. JEL0797]|nr:hypothetical protein HDU98_007215 [Podochytrium sp. JEL0797]
MTSVLHIPELLDAISVYIPPDEIHKVGQLNRRCRQLASFDILRHRATFAKTNLLLFILSVPSHEKSELLSELPLLKLGLQYVVALFELMGFCEGSIRLLHTKRWNLVTWADIMPDIYPSSDKLLISQALETLLAKLKPTDKLKTLDDPVLVLFWSCFFGSTTLLNLDVTKFLEDFEDDDEERETICHNAFMFACDSGDASVAEWVLGSNLVDLGTWGGQILADAARLGNVEIVEMVLRRNASVGVGALVENGTVAIACAWALENGHPNVVRALMKAGVTIPQEFLEHVSPPSLPMSSLSSVGLNIAPLLVAQSAE